MCVHDTRGRQRGLSIIELMVGVVVGLLVTLAAVGSATSFMSRQRQAVDVGSASGNAATGLAAIDYEVAHAGIGFFSNGALLCPRMNLSAGPAALVSNAAFPPISITVADGVTTLDTVYASALEAASPAALADNASNASTSVTIASYLPIVPGQQVMLVPAPGVDLPCTVRTATSVAASTPLLPQRLGFDAVGSANQVAFAPVAYTADDFLTQLGTLQWTRFRLAGTDLLMERPLEGRSVPMARFVMAFRAQYGIVDGSANTLSAWQKAEGAWASVDAARLPLVRAVRVGLLVRTDLPEKKDADGVCRATADVPVLFDEPVTLTDPDWACYRYRVMTVVVPLRNFIMGAAA